MKPEAPGTDRDDLSSRLLEVIRTQTEIVKLGLDLGDVIALVSMSANSSPGPAVRWSNSPKAMKWSIARLRALLAVIRPHPRHVAATTTLPPSPATKRSARRRSSAKDLTACRAKAHEPTER